MIFGTQCIRRCQCTGEVLKDQLEADDTSPILMNTSDCQMYLLMRTLDPLSLPLLLLIIPRENSRKPGKNSKENGVPLRVLRFLLVHRAPLPLPLALPLALLLLIILICGIEQAHSRKPGDHSMKEKEEPIRDLWFLLVHRVPLPLPLHLM